MKVYINGEAKIFEESSTITSLVEQFALNLKKVAVEVNRTIVPRSLYDKTLLRDGDKVEIVQFIGGG